VSVAAEYDEDYDAMRLSTPSLGAEQLHALGGHDKVLDAVVKLALDGQTGRPETRVDRVCLSEPNDHDYARQVALLDAQQEVT